MKSALIINLDKVAIGFSAICALHCILLPVALIFLPALSTTFLGSEDFHKALLYFVVPSSTIALFLGCKMHGKNHVYVYGAVGIGALLIALFFGHDLFGESGEKLLTLLGAGIISLGHIKNQKLCAECCN